MTSVLGADAIRAADGSGPVSFPDGINTDSINGSPTPTALPYMVYTALLTQTGTNAPTALILNNTLGGVPVWSYIQTGTYMITLSGGFVIGKTFPVISGVLPDIDGGKNAVAVQSDVNSIFVQTGSGVAMSFSDDYLLNTPFEIRVYL